MTDLDPRTPVLVGVGQAGDRLGDPHYRCLSPADLAAAAASAALRDSGLEPARVAPLIDTIGAIRQFENSVPKAVAPFGRSNNFPRSVGARIGANPRRAVLEISGGQGPQHLLTELADSISSGESDVVLLVGAEAMSTVRAFLGRDDAPDWREELGGPLEDRGFGLEGLVTDYLQAHELTGAPNQYALFENARRYRLGRSRDEYALAMGELFAPFTRVAAGNPLAVAPTPRSARELITVSGQNRVIADPYPRLLVSRDLVNQGAAVVLMSVATARELGVPEPSWVFLHGHADVRAPDLLDREDLGAAPAFALAIEHALAVADVTAAELRHLDLYSCFPIAVSAVCDGLGLAADDPRGLTVTGGLPFFGGPGNNYSMHAIAEIARRVRAEPGSYGLVGANGGTLSKYSVGVYSTTPGRWQSPDNTGIQRQVNGWAVPRQVRHADGQATVETYTVDHDRPDPVGIVVGRLETGERFLATTVSGDDETLAVLSAEQPVGARMFVRPCGAGNRAAVRAQQLEELR